MLRGAFVTSRGCLGMRALASHGHVAAEAEMLTNALDDLVASVASAVSSTVVTSEANVFERAVRPPTRRRRGFAARKTPPLALEGLTAPPDGFAPTTSAKAGLVCKIPSTRTAWWLDESPLACEPEESHLDDKGAAGGFTVHNPSAGMLERQQAALTVNFHEDRILQFQRGQAELSARLEKAREKALEAQKSPPLPVADDLDAEVVEGILSSVVADPGERHAKLQEARLQESLATQLEQLITCNPPAALRLQPPPIHCHQRRNVGGSGCRRSPRHVSSSDGRAESADDGSPPLSAVRVVSVERAGTDCLDIVFDIACSALKHPSAGGYDSHLPSRKAADLAVDAARKMEWRLNAASSELSIALARRMSLSLFPQLFFRAAEEEERLPTAIVPVSPLWHVRKRARRLNIHTAARCWAASMHW